MTETQKGSLAGKTVLVTGATTGIGKMTALGLARLGPTLVIVGRDPARAEAARAELATASGNPKIEILLADLSSQASIRKLALDFQAKHEQLHVLVNNAGAIRMERSVTVDGVESTFAVNHLAYFLLVNLLLDVLKKSAPARIVNVSSQVHVRGKLDFADLNHEKSYKGFQVYSDSKLANVYFTYELARRLEGTGVTVNCLHPGVVASNFGQGDGTGWLRFAVKLAKPFFITPADGAKTSIYLASSPEVEGVTGKYFDKCKPAESSRRSHDPAVAQQLWSVSEQLTGLGT
jgi:NAD(P)-dependent dehydrogenase (short-subunit alcohol dehydrogenase family)